MSSREKSGVVVARLPTTTKVLMGWRMGGQVDLLFVSEILTGNEVKLRGIAASAIYSAIQLRMVIL